MSHVYFVTDGRAIKIGFAQSGVRERMGHLQIGNPMPLFLLGAIEGTWSDERALHRRFQVIRLGGEWFQKHPDLLAYIDELGAAGRLTDEDTWDEYELRLCECGWRAWDTMQWVRKAA